jgi:hypothetical protein
MTSVDQPAVYGITRPTSADAARLLVKVFGAKGGSLMTELRRTANITEGDDRAGVVGRLAEVALRHDDPAVALCGRALQIRIGAFERLSSVQKVVAAVV